MRYSLLLIPTLLITVSMSAQIGVRPASNIANQPLWGPAGHDHVGYYYLPDIETYYDVSQRRYYTRDGHNWISNVQLPARYNGYDFYSAYKVVLNEWKPYRNHAKHKVRYASFKGRHDQLLIRDSRDVRYYVIKGHPGHHQWMQGTGNGRGKSKGQNRGKKH